jgi:putative chitinase
MTSEQLISARIFSGSQIELWVDELNRVASAYEIDENSQRLTIWLAQIAHESGKFTQLIENLNYSAEGLLRVFPKYFNGEQATQYARKPKMIASRVYANRYGNGNEESGEGYAYRGRGLIQITFKDNYRAFGRAMGREEEVLTHPDMLTTIPEACESAAWFFKKSGCLELADAGDFKGVTRRINGGLNGLADRQALWDQCRTVF